MSRQKHSGIFNGHKFVQIGSGIVAIPQSGAGLGDLFRSFFRWIIPAGQTIIKQGAQVAKSVAKSKLAKDAAKTLKRDAINAGIDLAQSALKGGDVKKDFKSKAKKIANNLSSSVSTSLNDYRPPKKKRNKKRLKEDNLS